MSAPHSGRSKPKRSDKRQAPREHGFWVLLSLSVGAALLKSPGWFSLLAAIATVAVTIFGAMVIGKRIRKNPRLQAAASVLIAFTSLPVLLVGGIRAGEAAQFALPLGLAFLSGTFCVRAIFERARKAPKKAALAASASVLIPVTAAFALLFLGITTSALALSITAIYAAALMALAPSAKQLRAVGLSISVAHLASALLLTF